MFPLHPETPGAGQSLEELFAGRLMDLDLMKAQLKQVASGLGLPFGDRQKTFNSRLAQELGKWAEFQGKGEQFHYSVFRAYFADGKNIGDIPILVDIAESVGLSGVEAKNSLETRAFRDAVDADWVRSRKMGVTAVPTFVFNNEHLVGAQPYAMLEQFVRENDAQQ